MGTMGGKGDVEEKLTLKILQSVRNRKISSNNFKSKAIWIRLKQIYFKRRKSTGKQEKQEKYFVIYDFGTEYEQTQDRQCDTDAAKIKSSLKLVLTHTLQHTEISSPRRMFLQTYKMCLSPVSVCANQDWHVQCNFIHTHIGICLGRGRV